jgi:hypothetical protein
MSIRFVMTALFLGSVLSLGCSSSDDSGSGAAFSCDTFQSKCPNAPAPTQADRDKCKAAVADPKCGSLATAAYQCMLDNEQCEADGGSTLSAACDPQVTAEMECALGGMLGDAGLLGD